MTDYRPTKIRPGLLVALKTTISGGVHYARRDLAQSEELQQWETTKTIDDPDEHKRAVYVRGQALNLVRRECIASGFGLVCLKRNRDSLMESVRKARELIAEFNEGARYSRISLSMLIGEVADDDAEAVSSVLGEVADQLRRMEDAVQTLDVSTLRDAADKARAMSAMLGETERTVAQNAVAAARKVARTIVKRTAELGEVTLATLDKEIDTAPISLSRMAFLETIKEVDARAGKKASKRAAEEPEPEAAPSIELQRFADITAAEVIADVDYGALLPVEPAPIESNAVPSTEES